MSTAILIAVTNNNKLGNTGKQTGWYLPEVSHPYDEFVKAGFKVDFVSPKGGVAPVDEGSVKTYENDASCAAFLKNEEALKKLKNTFSPSQIKAKEYKALYFAGGHGPMYDMPDCKEMQQLATQIYENKGVVGAVCHGPCGLVNIKLSNGEYLVKGKKVCGFTNSEEEAVNLTQAMPFLLESKLKERGAIFVGAANWQANVQVDERLVTGQNPASASPSGKAVVDLLHH